MYRGVAYVRYSSDKQREESIEAQVRSIREYCERHNIELVKIYADEARSATTDDRPQFKEMIKDSGLHMFEAVIVHKLDRFSRNRYDSAIYKRKLKENGITLMSVSEQLDGSPESVILESVLEGMAEYYSRNLAREVMKGMKENAFQSKHCGGIPPMGFSFTEEQHYEASEQATIVQNIFEMYSKGYTYNAIIGNLNEKGHYTINGNEFTRSTIYEMLNNEKYIGTFVFNKTSPKQPNGKKNSRKRKPIDEIIRVEGGTPALIDEDTWNMAQDRLRSKSKGMNSAKYDYLLSSLVKCSSCNSTMKGNSIRANGETYLYYRCSSKCGAKQIKAKSLEQASLDALEPIISYPEGISFSEMKTIIKRNIKGIMVSNDEINIELFMTDAESGGADSTKVIKLAR